MDAGGDGGYKPRGGYRGRGSYNSHYNGGGYQQPAPQQFATNPPQGWSPQAQTQQFAPPAPQYQAAPQAAPVPAEQSVPKIFVRSDGCDAFLDLRVILPSDRYPNINWGGRIIGHKGATIRELQSEYNIKLMINTDGQMTKDPTYNPTADPPHVRIQGSGPLGDVLRRMAGVADELAKRFDPYWKDEKYQEQKDAVDAEDDKSGDEGSDKEDGDSKPANDSFRGRGRGRGGYRGRGRGDFRGGRGFRGGFRGARGGQRGGYQGQGGPIRPAFHQSHAPGPY